MDLNHSKRNFYVDFWDSLLADEQRKYSQYLRSWNKEMLTLKSSVGELETGNSKARYGLVTTCIVVLGICFICIPKLLLN